MGCAVELASTLTAATILADAAVTPTVSEMTYNVSSGTLNHTQRKYRCVRLFSCDGFVHVCVGRCMVLCSVSSSSRSVLDDDAR